MPFLFRLFFRSLFRPDLHCDFCARVKVAGLGFAFLNLLAGCSMLEKRVEAFDRAILSKPGMALIENSKESMAMNHMFNAREGSVGGLGGAGGGCGCN